MEKLSHVRADCKFQIRLNAAGWKKRVHVLAGGEVWSGMRGASVYSVLEIVPCVPTLNYSQSLVSLRDRGGI